MKLIILPFIFLMFFVGSLKASNNKDIDTLSVGVIGLTHSHVHWILGRLDRGDIKIVGVVEPNRELAQRYATKYGFSMAKVFDTMEEMIAKTEPEAVTAFGTIYDHLNVVETCAPRHSCNG